MKRKEVQNMRELTPSNEEWKELYQWANRFNQLKSWTFMDEDDIFGVKDPEGDMIGYCSILGALDETFGMAVYLGGEGLMGYFHILEEGLHSSKSPSIHKLNCLLVSFEDRVNLQKEDYMLIKGLGLTFRGRNQWPVFRQYTPGFHPWYLQKNHVRFLTRVLEQACEISLRFKDDVHLFLGEDSEEILVRFPSRKKEGVVWEDRWILPDYVSEKKEEPPLDELFLYRVKNKALLSDALWIADVFYSPAPVQENKGERPYYPPVFLLIDGSSGIIMNFQIYQNNNCLEEIRTSFLNTLENNGISPKLILFDNHEVKDIFEPLASKLGITLRVEDDLFILEEIKENLFDLLP